MTKNEFLALWNLKNLNDLAFQKYKDLDYTRRERVLPQADSTNYRIVMDDTAWQNLLRKNEWYERWEFKVEHHLASFKEESTIYLLAFHNLDLTGWTDTVANRLEKQMEVLSGMLNVSIEKHQLKALRKSHYDPSSKSLYLIQLRDRQSWKVRVVDFSKTSRPAELLELIYEEPLEHHDFDDLEFKIGDKSHSNIEAQDRSLYYALQNINKKINKDTGSKVDLLNIENSQAWVDSLHI